MIKFVIDSPDKLKDKYKVSSRVALRIGVLLSKKIGVSPALTEMIAEINALEKFLLDKRINVNSSELSHDKFNEIISEFSSDDDF